MNIFTQVADIKTSDMVDIEKPITNRHTIVAQPCEITKKYIEELSKRADAIRRGSVKPEEDNMLAVTNDGRKIGLDIRLMNNYLPDNPTSKVNMCVQKIFDIWDNTKEDKLTQLLFSDLSTPKAGKDAGFNIYDDVREKLVAKGIPREEVQFIHEAKNDAQKKALFEKVRNGEVRILLGSTEKLGSGTNVQTKLKALHNLDVTWTPKDLEQRIGRISRQGNENKEVDVYNYVTESTFDAYMYQLIENKQKGISQIMTSKEIARRFADIDETVLNYAEIKALCSGNPLIKVKLDLEKEINTFEIMRRSHANQRHRLEDIVNQSGPERLFKYQYNAKNIKADLETLQKNPFNKEMYDSMPDDEQNYPDFEINSKIYNNKKEVATALMSALNSLVGKQDYVSIGKYRGFDVRVRYDFRKSEYNVCLRGNHSYFFDTPNNNPIGNLTRLNNAISEVNIHKYLEEFETDIKHVTHEIETAKSQLTDTFPQEAEYQELLVKLEELNKGLGIGVDMEFEMAEKNEIDNEHENEFEENNDIDFEDEEQSFDSDLDVSDSYEEYSENISTNNKQQNNEVKRKKAYEVAI